MAFKAACITKQMASLKSTHKAHLIKIASQNRIGLYALVLASCAATLLGGCDQAALPAGGSPTSEAALVTLPSPTTDGRAFATAKAQFETDHESTRIAEITAVALTPTRPIPTYPPYETPEPLPTGIRQIGNLGANPCDCALEGPAWRGILNGWYLNLYAGGSVGFDSGQGMVMLDSQTLDGHTTTMELFNTPTRSGSVRILSADGLRVTMLSTDGTQFVFDAGMRAWIPPSGTPVPAPTVP
jgi:hypothetical protein